MQFKLISDNTDTLIGMRLAGIRGVIVHTSDEVKEALRVAMNEQEIAIVLITSKLVDMCRTWIYELKSTCKRPLIVEIPDGQSANGKKDVLTGYIRDAIGVKI